MTHQMKNANANTNKSGLSFSAALRGSSQATKALGQKGVNGSAMVQSRHGTKDCIYEVNKIVQDTPIEDSKDRVNKVLRYCDEVAKRNPTEAAQTLSDLLVLILSKRQVRGGEGLRDQFYHLFVHLYEHEPDLREYLLKMVRFIPHLGRFKDYWQILAVINNRETETYHTQQLQLKHFDIFNDLVTTIIECYLAQIRTDMASYKKAKSAPNGEKEPPAANISLAAKYAPHEGRSFGKKNHWFLPIYRKGKLHGLCRKSLFHMVTIRRWEPQYTVSLQPAQVSKISQSNPNMKKLLMKTRMMFSLLNKYLQTPEVLMSAQQYSDIEFKNVASICLMKHMDAFKNLKKRKHGPKEVRDPYNQDRIDCAENFANHMRSGKVSSSTCTPVSIYQQVRQCSHYNSSDLQDYEELWKGVMIQTAKDVIGYYVQLKEKQLARPTSEGTPEDKATAEDEAAAEAAADAANYQEFFAALQRCDDSKKDKPLFRELAEELKATSFLQNTEELEVFYRVLKKRPNTEQIKILLQIISLFIRGVIPVMDVSGSMGRQVTPNTSCMDICVSLGILFTYLNPGEFKDLAISFTNIPMILDFKDMTLQQRIQKVFQHTGLTTDVQKMMRCYLDIAVQNQIPEEDLPDIVIFSDEGFDTQICKTPQAGWNGSYYSYSPNSHNDYWTTATESFNSMFREAGYSSPPQIYYVNLAATERNLQELPTRKGVSQLSGYNAAMFQQIMTGDEVLKTLGAAAAPDAADDAAADAAGKKSTEDDFQGKVQNKYFDLFRILMSQTKSGLLKHYTFEGNESAYEMLQESELMLALQQQRRTEAIEGRPASAPPTLVTTVSPPEAAAAAAAPIAEAAEDEAPAPAPAPASSNSLWGMMGWSS